jgi:ribosomal protein S18 acetylase RimI-like enzyme
MDINIRKIEEADLPVVVELIWELAVHHDLTQYCEVTVERLRQAFFGPNAMLDGLIAEDTGTTAGYALFCPHFSSFRGQTGLYLEDIYVREAYRGTGLGEKLIAATAKEASRRGYERIDFLVVEDNAAAIKFYRRLGAETNNEDRHYRITGEAFRRLLETEDQ